MAFRQTYPFRPIRGTTAPSFEIGATNVFTSSASVFESTALNRVWSGAQRSIRLAEKEGIDSHVNWGSSLITANSSDSILFLGGTVETFHIEPAHTYIAINSVSTSTGAKVNVTLGYGG